VERSEGCGVSWSGREVKGREEEKREDRESREKKLYI
jgi:hypothetical protein